MVRVMVTVLKEVVDGGGDGCSCVRSRECTGNNVIVVMMEYLRS